MAKLSILALFLFSISTCTTVSAWPRSRRKNATITNSNNNDKDKHNGAKEEGEQCSVELEFLPYDKNDKYNDDDGSNSSNNSSGYLYYAKCSFAGVLFSVLSMKLLQGRSPAKSTIGSDICCDEEDDTLGGLDDTDVVFDGIKLILTQKVKKKPDGTETPPKRFLLDGSLRGRAYAGRMMAIMGPSGAGKVRDSS
jgi:hypothetical protein